MDTWVPSNRSARNNVVLYVDATSRSQDSDPNTGSITSPFSSLAAAVTRSRTLQKPLDILLRQGEYYLDSTVVLTPADSGLRIANYPGESSVVSGGVPLDPVWTKSHECDGCFQAQLPPGSSVPGLRRGPGLSFFCFCFYTCCNQFVCIYLLCFIFILLSVVLLLSRYLSLFSLCLSLSVFVCLCLLISPLLTMFDIAAMDAEDRRSARDSCSLAAVR